MWLFFLFSWQIIKDKEKLTRSFHSLFPTSSFTFIWLSLSLSLSITYSFTLSGQTHLKVEHFLSIFCHHDGVASTASVSSSPSEKELLGFEVALADPLSSHWYVILRVEGGEGKWPKQKHSRAEISKVLVVKHGRRNIRHCWIVVRLITNLNTAVWALKSLIHAMKWQRSGSYLNRVLLREGFVLILNGASPIKGLMVNLTLTLLIL